MKRILLFTFVCTLAAYMYADDYFHPMLQDGKKWETDIPAMNLKHVHYIDGDTIINGKTWKKAYSNEKAYPDTAYFAAVREEGKRVYVKYQGRDEERLLYDFDIQPGAYFWCCQYDLKGFVDFDKGETFISHEWLTGYRATWNHMVLKNIDTVEVSGQKLRRFIFYSEYDLRAPSRTGKIKKFKYPDYVWVEGIGAEGSLFQPWSHYYLLFSEQVEVKCSINGTPIFEYSDFFQSGDTSYRPLIEDGKVWRVGWIPDGNEKAKRIDRFYLDGDTIIDNHLCKKMFCRRWTVGSSTSLIEYMAALCEEEKRVYCAFPGENTLSLLYAFDISEGDVLNVCYGPEGDGSIMMRTKVTRGKSSFDTGYYQGFVWESQTDWSDPDEIENIHFNSWLEGVGSWLGPLTNIETYSNINQRNEYLLTCTVDDELLYKSHLDYCDVEDPSFDMDDIDVKKHWLDFTHTTKPRPKAPRKAENGESQMTNDGSSTDDVRLSGAYSDRELFVNLMTLQGSYNFTITNESGEEVYSQTVETSNVVALQTDLSQYVNGTYTICVENAEEAYTAQLVKGLDVAVRDIPAINRESVNGKSVNGKSVNGKWYDLSGRRLSSRPSQGLYIEDGKLRVATKHSSR